MKLLVQAIVILTFGTAMSCNSSKNVASASATQDMKNTYLTVAQEKFGEDVEFAENQDSTYVLCVHDHKGTVKQPRNSVQYMIYNLADNKVVHEETVGSGYVKWYSDYQIEIFRTPGIMRDDQTRDDFITIYNVKTGESVSKRSLMNSEKE